MFKSWVTNIIYKCFTILCLVWYKKKVFGSKPQIFEHKIVVIYLKNIKYFGRNINIRPIH